ncbi:hypothetical protein L6164_023438 [Bauhinia variegata]|uniref:Uncharacterized protein n=1 Tax=Bauhinia variegata TaxID=167791 RepID=A0ACB9MI69_BAUVA|nr:hypothetical protein L6164_023438 [Bauhinia variegata]
MGSRRYLRGTSLRTWEEIKETYPLFELAWRVIPFSSVNKQAVCYLSDDNLEGEYCLKYKNNRAAHYLYSNGKVDDLSRMFKLFSNISRGLVLFPVYLNSMLVPKGWHWSSSLKIRQVTKRYKSEEDKIDKANIVKTGQIRGGGATSFGVVLSYTVKLVPIPETITNLKVVKTLADHATAFALKWQGVGEKITEDLFLKLNLDLEKTEKGEKTVRASFVGLFLGRYHILVNIMRKSFPELGLKEPHCNEMSWAQSFVANKLIEALLDRSFNVSYFKGKLEFLEKPISKEGFEGP